MPLRCLSTSRLASIPLPIANQEKKKKASEGEISKPNRNRERFCRLDDGLYLNIDFLVEFQGRFVDILCLPLYSLNCDTRGSQIDLWMLQINCVDRQIDKILLIFLLIRSLCPENCYRESA